MWRLTTFLVLILSRPLLLLSFNFTHWSLNVSRGELHRYLYRSRFVLLLANFRIKEEAWVGRGLSLRFAEWPLHGDDYNKYTHRSKVEQISCKVKGTELISNILMPQRRNYLTGQTESNKLGVGPQVMSDNWRTSHSRICICSHGNMTQLNSYYLYVVLNTNMESVLCY